MLEKPSCKFSKKLLNMPQKLILKISKKNEIISNISTWRCFFFVKYKI